MAYGYWKLGMMERQASFLLLLRRRPFEGNYAIAAGLQKPQEFTKQQKGKTVEFDLRRAQRNRWGPLRGKG